MRQETEQVEDAELSCCLPTTSSGGCGPEAEMGPTRPGMGTAVRIFWFCEPVKTLLLKPF